MSVESGYAPGSLLVDGKLKFFKKVPGNRPFCHFCRQQVPVVVVLERTSSSNPLHICRTCLFERLAGFDIIENA